MDIGNTTTGQPHAKDGSPPDNAAPAWYSLDDAREVLSTTLRRFLMDVDPPDISAPVESGPISFALARHVAHLVAQWESRQQDSVMLL